MHKVNVIAYAIGATLLGAILSLGITYGAFWYTTASQEADSLKELSTATLHRVNRAFTSSWELLSAYAVLDMPPCSPMHITVMRTGILDHPEIEEIGFVQDNILRCSSWGVANNAVEEKLPDFVTHNSMQVTTNVEPVFGKRHSRIAVQYGMYSALLNPALFNDAVDNPEVQLSVLTNTGVVLSTVNNPDRAQLAALLKKSDRMFDDGRLVSVLRDGDFVVIASESDRRFLALLASRHTTILTIAGLLSALIAGGIFWYARKKLSPLSLLAKAVENKEFVVHYQPIIDLSTKRCVGAEALVRWQKKDGTMVSPDLFIPLAERSGLILPITDQIIDMIVTQMASFLEEHPHTHIAVNISAHDMKTGRILAVLNKALARTSIRHAQIWLEATERGLMDIKAARIVIENARNDGYHVAIDDFGTGYSSLSHLQGLPLDTLKMDKSFVDTINAQSEQAAGTITNHIIAMARTLKMSVVAEGIENADQASYLGALNVEYGQGWLYSKALPADAFIAYYKAVDGNSTPTPPVTAPADTTSTDATSRDTTST